MTELGHHKGRVLGVGYLLGLMLVVIPAAELIIYALPFTPSAVRWRYGLVGYMGQGAALPTVGLIAAVMTAALLEHHRVLRVLAGFCLLSAVLLSASAVMLVLDTIQLRRSVETALQQNYDAASLKALLNIGFVVLITGWMGVTGWRASAEGRSERSRPPGPTIVAAGDRGSVRT